MWKQLTPCGVEVTSFERPMTEQELVDLDEEKCEFAETMVDEDYEDPDADGYGWERKALRGIP